MKEYEHSFKVESIKPYLDYCKEMGFVEKSVVTQNRIVYENKNSTSIIARLTTEIANGVETTIFDCKNVAVKKSDLNISTESLPMNVTNENRDIVLSMLNVLDFYEAANNLRTRYVYEKDGVKFEIDDYTRPQMQVVAIEGEEEGVERVYADVSLKINNESK